MCVVSPFHIIDGWCNCLGVTVVQVRGGLPSECGGTEKGGEEKKNNNTFSKSKRGGGEKKTNKRILRVQLMGIKQAGR